MEIRLTRSRKEGFGSAAATAPLAAALRASRIKFQIYRGLPLRNTCFPVPRETFRNRFCARYRVPRRVHAHRVSGSSALLLPDPPAFSRRIRSRSDRYPPTTMVSQIYRDRLVKFCVSIQLLLICQFCVTVLSVTLLSIASLNKSFYSLTPGRIRRLALRRSAEALFAEDRVTLSYHGHSLGKGRELSKWTIKLGGSRALLLIRYLLSRRRFT